MGVSHKIPKNVNPRRDGLWVTFKYGDNANG